MKGCLGEVATSYLGEMEHLIEQSLNGFLDEGRAISEELARLEGETSNDIFETLEDWNEQLKHIDFDIEEPRP